MRRLAPQHGLMFLIHEKPFAGINGSGKHNNWSMATDDGENLLDPGDRPARQRPVPGLPHRRSSAASTSMRTSSARASRTPARPSPRRQRGAARDHVDLPGLAARGRHRPARAGARVGVQARRRRSSSGRPRCRSCRKDATDRNRTSPFAFTGNKFEFRAVGSSAPIYWPQTVLNTAVADSLAQLADELEQLKPGDFDGLTGILSGIVKANKQVLFEGNGYSDGVARGGGPSRPAEQPRPRSTPCRRSRPTRPRRVFAKLRRAVRARARRARRHPLGALRQGRRHRGEHARSTSLARWSCRRWRRYLGRAEPGARLVAWHQLACASKVSALADTLVERDRCARARPARGARGRLRAGRGPGVRREVIPAQAALREVVDELETVVADDLWPLPKYRELLFQY